MSRQKRENAVRRSRWFLKLTGVFFIMTTMIIAKHPERSAPNADLICLAFGVCFFAIGHWASSRWIGRTVGVMTGW